MILSQSLLSPKKSQNHGEDHENLNLEERRLRNIARNQQFLRELFSSGNADEQILSDKTEDDVTVDGLPYQETEESMDFMIEQLKTTYPYRDSQIDELHGYLQLEGEVSVTCFIFDNAITLRRLTLFSVLRCFLFT